MPQVEERLRSLLATVPSPLTLQAAADEAKLAAHARPVEYSPPDFEEVLNGPSEARWRRLINGIPLCLTCLFT